MSDKPDIAGEFDRAHSARLASPTLHRIWRQAYREEYPEAVTPSAFYALSTLRQLREGLHLAAGATVADLGCGNGGAGLWLARELGVSVTGIDLSGSGVANASRRAAELGLGSLVQFRTGDLTATGLPPASCDGAICLDVLPFVPDKAAAFREVARILPPERGLRSRPGSRAGFHRASTHSSLLTIDPRLSGPGSPLSFTKNRPSGDNNLPHSRGCCRQRWNWRPS